MSLKKIKYGRPKLVLSRCLRGDRVRYNAELLKNSLFVELKPYIDLITVCPEVQMGMPVPRPPIQIHQAEKPILFQPSTETDFSDAMAKLCNQLNYTEIDGFLLKARSPSCGIIDTPHYVEAPSNELKSRISDPGQGLFTYIMKTKHKNVVFCDEDRFSMLIYRDWFLTSCFASVLRRSDISNEWKLLDELLIPNLSFETKLINLWPKKLYKFYLNLATRFKSKIAILPQFSGDPRRQLEYISTWRTNASTKTLFKDLGPLIQPYPHELSFRV